MRLWTFHPRYLDPKGLVAVWREALLAQAVLQGQTEGYRHHPQLRRFAAKSDPIAAIGTYLQGIAQEARSRGYRFDESLIVSKVSSLRIIATTGQLVYEWKHFQAKVRKRSPAWFRQHCRHNAPMPHRMFRLRAGGIANWERPTGNVT